MSCSFDKELLERYVDSAADSLEQIFIEEHIKVCSECAAYLKELFFVIYSLPLLRVKEEQLPVELDIRTKDTLNKLLPPASTWSIFRGTVANTVRFVRFVPGVSATTAIANKGLRQAPRFIWGLSSQVLRGGVKLAQVLS